MTGWGEIGLDQYVRKDGRSTGLTYGIVTRVHVGWISTEPPSYPWSRYYVLQELRESLHPAEMVVIANEGTLGETHAVGYKDYFHKGCVIQEEKLPIIILKTEEELQPPYTSRACRLRLFLR